jgi:hypothetical protein
MRCISCAVEYRRMKIVWMIGEDIPLGDGKGTHIVRMEGPAGGYALYLLRPGMEGTGGGGGALQKGQMIGEDIPFADGEGMH